VIIDSHTHVDDSPILGWSDPAEVIIGLLDEAEIERAVIMTYRDAPGLEEGVLEYVAAAVQKYPDRLMAYARMNPRYGDEALDLFDRAIRDYGMRGLKLHPVGYVMHPANDLVLNLIRHAAALNVPTLFHCGDEEFSLPLQVAEAAALVPEARIILGHMGGYFHVRDAIRAARRLPNLILETSAMPYPRMIREAVEVLGAERILFASDGPGCDPSIEVEKVRRAGLTPEQESLILSGNTARLLGLASSTGEGRNPHVD
jgi:predicted TIM-barrel fold metal-dependent hydrolase